MSSVPAPVPPENNPNEVSFSEILLILFKRKKLISYIFYIFFFGAIFFFFAQLNLFEGHFALKIGKTKMGEEIEQIENPNNLNERLLIQYPNIISAKINEKGSKDVIKLVVRGASYEQVEKDCQKILDDILGLHHKRSNELLDILEKQLQSLDEQALSLQDSLGKISEMARHKSEAAKESSVDNSLSLFLLTLEKNDTFLQLAELRTEKNKLLENRFFTSHHFTNSLVTPKIKRYLPVKLLLIISVASLFLGIIVVLAIELWERIKILSKATNA